MKIFRNLVKKIINKPISRKVNINSINSKDIVCVDLGASSIKMSYNGNCITFRSSVRKVLDINEITVQKNFINVNGEYFIVGESTQSTGNYFYKYEKEYLNVLILFGLVKLGVKESNINTHIVLPYNQLNTLPKIQSKVNGVYQVKTLDEEVKVNLVISKAYVEGETSKVYFENRYNILGNICIVNIGYSTVDITLYDDLGNREIISSINIGTNNLLSNYLRHTKAPTSSVLSNWMAQGYKFSNIEKKYINIENEKYINTLWNDLYNGVLRIANPQNTSIILCGGGSILLKDTIKDFLSNTDFKIIIPSNEDSIFSDLKGIELLSSMSNRVNDITLNNNEESKGILDEVNEVNKDINEVLPSNEVSPSKPSKVKGENYMRFKNLKNQGYNNNDIVDILGLKKQTIANYSTRYKKELSKVS